MELQRKRRLHGSFLLIILLLAIIGVGSDKNPGHQLKDSSELIHKNLSSASISQGYLNMSDVDIGGLNKEATSIAFLKTEPKQILILASCNPGMRWTDLQGSSIENELSIYYPNANFTFEYMDTKKQAPTKARLAELRDLYENKYRGRHFEVILCSDDDAFNFLLENRDALFPGSSAVFCGVNFFDDDKANLEILNQTLPEFSSDVNFAIWDNMTVQEIQRNASSLSNDSLILLLNFNRDRAGRVLTHEESAWILGSASPVPIYGPHDVYLGYGAVGGAIASGQIQGSMAADLVECDIFALLKPPRLQFCWERR